MAQVNKTVHYDNLDDFIDDMKDIDTKNVNFSFSGEFTKETTERHPQEHARCSLNWVEEEEIEPNVKEEEVTPVAEEES